MAATLLITAAEVIERAIPDANFDEGYLKDRYIESAQLNYLRPLLGDDFYDLVVADVDSYSALMPYVKDMLAFYIVRDALPIIHVHLSSRGVVTNGNEFNNVAGRDHRADLEQSYTRWAKEYEDKLVRHLSDNTSTYTDWGRTTINALLGGILM